MVDHCGFYIVREAISQLTVSHNMTKMVDMGRNIFQSEDPVAIIQAVKEVVHDNESPEKAFDLYNTLKNKG